jgi:uncharacterized integral membrane protein (TIGR00698 family)
MAALFQEWQKIGKEFVPARVGLHLVLGVAIASRFLHSLIGSPLLKTSVSEILVAVVLGLYLRNALGLGESLKAGIKFSIQRVLRFGIVLLGLRLSLQDVAATGGKALILVTICITVALSLAILAGRLFKVPPRLAALIGVGTAICGNTAIVATAPVLEADEEEVSFAVATITLFGLLAVLVYPFIGHLLALSDRAFGLWAGTAVNDTSQVVAVGTIFSEAALDVATVVKLTRNTLMAPLIVLFGLFYSRGLKREMSDKAAQAARLDWRKLVPGFVIGFLILSLVRTLGVALGFLPQSLSNPGNLHFAASALKFLDQVSKFAILMALAGVGLNTDLGSLRRIGFKPLIVGTCVAVVLAVFSLGLILLTPLGG